jgi:hypothetical protein
LSRSTNNIQGIVVFDWYMDIIPLLTNTSTNKSHKGTMINLSVPFRHYHPYPMIPNVVNNNYDRWKCNGATNHGRQTKYPEINHTIIVDEYIYGAVNDQFGCYKWDIHTGQIVTTYTMSSSCINNYLYTMEYVSNTNELLTGGENGVLGIWDPKTNQYIDVIDVNVIVERPKNSNFSTNNSNPNSNHQSKRQKNNSSHNITSSRVWISECLVWKEQWWIVGGGFHRSRSDEYVSQNGYIAIFHGPTRALLSFVTTLGQIQSLTCYTPKNHKNNDTTENNSAIYDEAHLIALSNTNYIFKWTNPLSLHAAPQQRIYCHTPSAYSIAIETEHTRFAIGGVGSTIDIFDTRFQLCEQVTT